MDDIFTLLGGIAGCMGGYSGEKIGCETVGNYTVDTCDTCDCGFETAIWKNSNPMVIVERYADSDDAAIGHKKWIEFCKDNPVSVYSAQLDKECSL